MKIKSLTGRVLAYISILAFVGILAASVFLSEIFRISVEERFDEQLEVSLKILVGEVAAPLAVGQTPEAPDNLGDPRFSLPLSGWYWTIYSLKEKRVILSSTSISGGQMAYGEGEVSQIDGTNRRHGYGIGPDNKRLRILERKISFGRGTEVLIRVSGNAQELSESVQTFQRQAWLTLWATASLPLFLLYFVIRFSLRPLYEMQDNLRKVREGKSKRIEGKYPTEISGLVKETNALLGGNEQLLERARTQVGNLAHGLKTPLSVIMNEARSMEGPATDRLDEQVQTMRDQVQLYLERARMAAQHNVLGASTHIAPILQRLASVMVKIHRRDGFEISCEIDEDIRFQGEEHDLEEMVGNLVDNACKWASHNVHITVEKAIDIPEDMPSDEGDQSYARIAIDDDGPGLTADEMREVKRRGHRLDETKPGTGLGLSIVEELVTLYKGSFTLSVSELGGLRVELILPAN